MLSQNTSTFSSDRYKTDNIKLFQSSHGEDKMCTMLIGSPGPTCMQYVTIPCHKQIHVSGLMCAEGGKSISKHSPEFVYILTHLKENYATLNTSTLNTSRSYFNIDYKRDSFSKYNTYNCLTHSKMLLKGLLSPVTTISIQMNSLLRISS